MAIVIDIDGWDGGMIAAYMPLSAEGPTHTTLR